MQETNYSSVSSTVTSSPIETTDIFMSHYACCGPLERHCLQLIVTLELTQKKVYF